MLGCLDHAQGTWLCMGWTIHLSKKKKKVWFAVEAKSWCANHQKLSYAINLFSFVHYWPPPVYYVSEQSLNTAGGHLIVNPWQTHLPFWDWECRIKCWPWTLEGDRMLKLYTSASWASQRLTIYERFRWASCSYWGVYGGGRGRGTADPNVDK